MAVKIIRIGNFSISELGDGSLWLYNELGEGMKLDLNQIRELEKLIKELYQKYF